MSRRLEEVEEAVVTVTQKRHYHCSQQLSANVRYYADYPAGGCHDVRIEIMKEAERRGWIQLSERREQREITVSYTDVEKQELIPAGDSK